MRRYDNLTSYIIKKSRFILIVTLERLNNTASGNPRFKALVTIYSNGEKQFNNTRNTHNYTFQGHYMSDKQEAEWIANKVIETIKGV